MAAEYGSARRRSGRRAGSSGSGSSGSGHTAQSREAAGPEQDGLAAQARGDDDPEERARQICLRLLTVAPRTRAQLAAALGRRGIPDEAAEAVLSRFTDAGLIDDAAFARGWVESRHHGRGLSGRVLSTELRRRGVDDEQIRQAVDGLGPDAEIAAARRLAERKLASMAGQPPQVRVRRLAGMLARKGYPPGLAFRVIREALERESTSEAGAALENMADALEADGLEAEALEAASADSMSWEETPGGHPDL